MRSFCRCCGTPLIYERTRSRHMFNIPRALFHTRRVWKDANGTTRLEAYSIAGMAHGVPLATAGGDGCGLTGPFFLEAGISSTALITRSWGLDTAGAPKTDAKAHVAVDRAPAAPAFYPALAHAGSVESLGPRKDQSGAYGARLTADPATVIEAAFKAAGLPVPERSGASLIDPASIISAALQAAGLKRS